VVSAGYPSHYASSLTFQVEPREESCFYEDVIQGSNYILEFEVIRGGLLDIRVRVIDPSGNILIDKLTYFNKNDEALNEAEGRISFNAAYAGQYRMCFDNTMSRWTPKVVSFFIPAETAKTSSAYNLKKSEESGEHAKLEHLGPMVDSIIKISDELEAVESLQHHLRVREQAQRDHAEVTHDRLSYLGFLESVCMIVITVGQLYYVQSWFKETRRLGRV
jgi:hypothetical protein